jgi:hypothetical protein
MAKKYAKGGKVSRLRSSLSKYGISGKEFGGKPPKDETGHLIQLYDSGTIRMGEVGPTNPSIQKQSERLRQKILDGEVNEPMVASELREMQQRHFRNNDLDHEGYERDEPIEKARGGKIGSLSKRMHVMEPGRREIVQNIRDWSDGTPEGLTSAHQEHCEALGIDPQSKEGKEILSQAQQGYARGGRIAAAQQRGKGALSMATNRPEPKTASRTRSKRPARVAGMLAEADQTLAEGGRALSRKYAGGGKVEMGRGLLREINQIKKTTSNLRDALQELDNLNSLNESEHEEASKLLYDHFTPLHPSGPTEKFAEGGKVGPAVAALRRLAAKFEGELNMGDHDSARRTARQMDLLEPGASQTAMDALSKGPNRATADKLATFAKGGKVSKTAKIIHSERPKKMTEVEFVRSVPDHGGDFDLTESKPWSKKEIHDNIGDYLEEAGHPRGLAKHFSVKKDPEFLEFDSGNPTHAGAYFSTQIEGPDHLVDAIDKSLSED